MKSFTMKNTTLKRELSSIDRLLVQVDRAVRTVLAPSSAPTRPSPAGSTAPASDELLSPQERRHVAGLMRVNHTGEICAQALYQGQALTARLPAVREEMERAAAEETDHLAWCEERVVALGERTSRLNPLWYGMSFALGATAGLISDRLSLGFVAATEDQVCKHLSDHLEQLPRQDQASRDVVSQMLKDESRHGHNALQAGGIDFPKPVKGLMSLASKVMTSASYRL